MTFAMIVCRRPPSGSKGRNKKFQGALRTEAQTKLGARAPLTGALYARITWFHRQRTTQDVDNIAKNILDALKGTVFADDFSITQCLTSRTDLTKDYELDNQNIEPGVYDELIAALADEQHGHVLYIEVGEVAVQRVVFGPIDGGSR